MIWMVLDKLFPELEDLHGKENEVSKVEDV